MNKINENGRSMIEMLGVLAIIGVLSGVELLAIPKLCIVIKSTKP